MAKIVILTGSPSRSSRLFGIVDYATQALEQAGFEVSAIHATDLPAEDLLFARFDSPAIQGIGAAVASADAVIVASPVYKASYTGLLKAVLDLLPQKGLVGKPVLPLFIGGTIAHFLSIDYALKPVLSALGARHLLTGVFAVDSQVARNEQGEAVLNEELCTRLDVALTEYAEIVKLLAGRAQQIESGNI